MPCRWKREGDSITGELTTQSQQSKQREIDSSIIGSRLPLRQGGICHQMPIFWGIDDDFAGVYKSTSQLVAKISTESATVDAAAMDTIGRIGQVFEPQTQTLVFR